MKKKYTPCEIRTCVRRLWTMSSWFMSSCHDFQWLKKSGNDWFRSGRSLTNPISKLRSNGFVLIEISRCKLKKCMIWPCFWMFWLQKISSQWFFDQIESDFFWKIDNSEFCDAEKESWQKNKNWWSYECSKSTLHNIKVHNEKKELREIKNRSIDEFN